MPGSPAARLHDPIAHSNAHAKFWAKVAGGVIGGMVAGALACAVIVATGGMAAPLIVVAGATLLTTGGLLTAAAGAVGGLIGEKLVDTFMPDTYTVTGKIQTASPNVFVNSKSTGAARASAALPVDEVTCSRDSPLILIAEGSETVFVNQVNFARKGDAVECGATIFDGSPDVFVGDPKARLRKVADEVPLISRMAGTVLGLVVGGLGIRALLKAPGTLASKLPCLGSMLLGTGIGMVIGAIGGPVHAATGAKILSGDLDTDFELPGPLPLRWRRFYNSMDTRGDTGHGPGWGGEYFVRLDIAADGSACYTDEQGRPVPWEPLEPGHAQENIAEGYKLIRAEDGQYVVEGADGLYRLFEPQQPATAGQMPEAPSTWRLARVQDANGNHISLQYRHDGLLDGITDSTGRRLQLSYTQAPAEAQASGAGTLHNARIAQIDIATVAPGETPGTLVRYQYDSHGRLSAVLDAEGRSVRGFAYDAAGLMTEHRNAAGLSSHYEWAPFADHPRVVRQWNSAGHEWRISYRLPAPDSQAAPAEAGNADTDAMARTGGHTQATDHLGRSYEWQWDRAYNITLATGPQGQRLAQEWNALRQLLASTDALGRRTTYAYDPHGNLAQQTDPLGRVTRTTWLGLWALPIVQLLPDGSRLSWRYDRLGNLLAHTGADGGTTEYLNDNRGLPVRITDARGGTAELRWSARAQLIQYTDCSGRTTTHDWDGRGHPARSVDALGQITGLRHDAQGRLRTLNLPDNSHHSFDWDAAGQLVRSSDALGRTTAYAYNAYGQLTAHEDAESRQVLFTYDGAHRLSSLINENGEAFRFAYDDADRLVQETRVGGQRVTVEYDATGWPVAVTHWPAMGDELLVGDGTAGAGQTPEIPGWGGQVDGAADTSGPQPRRTELLRDAVGRLIEKRTASHHTHYRYDVLDQLLSATRMQVQADGSLKPLHTSAFQYDLAGNVITETATDETTGTSHQLRHSHDALGNRTQTILPGLPASPGMERALNYLHYGSGHLHQINYSQRDTSVPDALAVHQLISDIERDALHRETLRTQGGARTRYALDPLGRRTGAWSKSAGIVHQPYGSGDAPWQKALQSAGTPQQSTLDGLMKAYAYDKVGELRQTRHSLRGDTTHRYDATGRVEQSTRQPFAGMAQAGPAAHSEHFEYDPAGNILDNQAQALLRSRTQHLQAGYVRDNLVRVFEDKRYYYDGHGRLIRKLSGRHTDQRFAWDEDNQLTEVTTTRRPGTEHASTQTVRFDYDAIGRRVAKHDRFGTTVFLWEGMRLIEERRGASTISYVYEPDSYVPLARLDADGEPTEQGGLGTTDDPQATAPAATAEAPASEPTDLERRYWASLNAEAQQRAQELQVEGWATATHGPAGNDDARLCKVYYFHTDQVGMPEELSNSQGQLVWQASYRTWGSTVTEEWEIKGLAGQRLHPLDQGDTPQSETEKQQNLRFQGQYLDRETGLHYNTFRYYDPDVGRFICPDPIGLNGGINLGSYSPNPIAWIDPWGWNPTCRMTGQRVNSAGKPLKSSELPVVKPGTKGWDDAVASLRKSGRGDVRVANMADARALMRDAGLRMNRRKMYESSPYEKGYEVHQPQPGRGRDGTYRNSRDRWQEGEADVGNDLPHIKWKTDNGRNQGHIFIGD